VVGLQTIHLGDPVRGNFPCCVVKSCLSSHSASRIDVQFNKTQRIPCINSPRPSWCHVNCQTFASTTRFEPQFNCSGISVMLQSVRHKPLTPVTIALAHFFHLFHSSYLQAHCSSFKLHCEPCLCQNNHTVRNYCSGESDFHINAVQMKLDGPAFLCNSHTWNREKLGFCCSGSQSHWSSRP